MHKLKYHKSQLLEIIKQNRDKHKEVFEDALNGYKVEVVKQLESRIDDVRQGKRFNQHFQLPEPMDMTREYDIVIRSLELTTEKTIELTQDEFRQYVMDDWHWKDQFNVTASNYSRMV